MSVWYRWIWISDKTSPFIRNNSGTERAVLAIEQQQKKCFSITINCFLVWILVLTHINDFFSSVVIFPCLFYLNKPCVWYCISRSDFFVINSLSIDIAFLHSLRYVLWFLLGCGVCSYARFYSCCFLFRNSFLVLLP